MQQQAIKLVCTMILWSTLFFFALGNMMSFSCFIVTLNWETSIIICCMLVLKRGTAISWWELRQVPQTKTRFVVDLTEDGSWVKKCLVQCMEGHSLCSCVWRGGKHRAQRLTSNEPDEGKTKALKAGAREFVDTLRACINRRLKQVARPALSGRLRI